MDASDPFLSSFFFNHALEYTDDPGYARFMFDARYIDYVMGHGSIVFEGTPAKLLADAEIRKEWLEV